MKRYRLIVWLVLGLASASPWGAPTAKGVDTAAGEASPQPAERSSTADAQIAELIQQLGSEDFAERELAQAELARIGLDAFDSLNDARKSDDIEIQLRARYLVRSMSVRWYADGDSPEVVRVLKGYGDLEEGERGERRVRMERLAKLQDRQGLGPLCRLARFETDPVLSKKAALLVMNVDPPTDEGERSKLVKTIVDTVGSSRRPASDWLRNFAKTLQSPGPTLAGWDAMIRGEQDTLARQPDQTSREIVRDLYRWQVALLQRLEQNDEAVAVIRRTINLLDGTPDQVTEIVDWLVEREAWDAVQEVAERFPGAFSESAPLLYRLAETQLKTGKKEAADETANRALALRSENLNQHLIIAYQLQSRGLFDWSEREYRAICEKGQPGTSVDFRSRFFFSELLHDHNRDKEAADILQPLATLMDQDEQAKAQAVNAGRDPEAIYARLQFFRARQLLQEEKTDQAREQFAQALAKDDTDADVLIALYRMKNNPEQAADIKLKIEHATAAYRAEIAEFSESLQQENNPQDKVVYSEQVATSCNQFAWLVSNTFGDFEEALRASHRSLDLKPETAGYLDTLGRCYYAKGDLENAVKYQRQAVKLEKHSMAIQRQLAQFEKELAEKKATEEAKAATPEKGGGQAPAEKPSEALAP